MILVKNHEAYNLNRSQDWVVRSPERACAVVLCVAFSSTWLGNHFLSNSLKVLYLVPLTSPDWFQIGPFNRAKSIEVSNHLYKNQKQGKFIKSNKIKFKIK